MSDTTDPPLSSAGAATRVLRAEADALSALADCLPEDFDAAVRLILSCEGRVILSGIGKSGHVARKIAATLASTGTPAFFVHPAEASHGDLGMVTPHDICLLISASGETAELRDLVGHCARFSIPVISITKARDNALARAAKLRLSLPDLPEACSIGMAPTTSTTMTMALGDALAVALMEQRRFRQDQFRDYHPGGSLGARLTPIHQIMHRADRVPLVSKDADMQETILVMTARGFGIAGVVDATGQLVGVISDGDLRRNMAGLLDRRAVDVCNRDPVTAAPDILAAEALALMNRAKIGALFVIDAGRPAGILHLHDLLRIGVA